MVRGLVADVGDTRVSQNGYHYTKVENRGWVLTHWLVMEKKIGRQVTDDEQVRFNDKKVKRVLAETGTCDAKDLFLIKKRLGSVRKRIAVVESRIEELQSELVYLNAQLIDEDEND